MQSATPPSDGASRERETTRRGDADEPRSPALGSAAGPGAFLAALATGLSRPAAAAEAGAPDPVVSAVLLWYVLLPGALLLAMVAILLISLKGRVGERNAPGAVHGGGRTLAYLEPRDGSSRRHPVTGNAYRIGRHSDNDLCVRDPSVSRQHAEIHRRRDGSFTITDLDSMNGVFVNQKKIDSVTLADGDVIELGDRSFGFRLLQEPERAGDEAGEAAEPSGGADGVSAPAS